MKQCYADLKKNYYSQNGEDGVLEGIFNKLGITEGWFVDVGAWNGVYLSNTYNLVLKGWNGFEIEGNKVRAEKMMSTLPGYITTVCRYVQPDDLDEILSSHYPPIPKSFDLLSIDIDSYDYWVWKNLKKYSPKVVVIEYNGQKDTGYIQPPDPNFKGQNGVSWDAMEKMANEKGYELLCEVGNLIFVRKDLYDNL